MPFEAPYDKKTEDALVGKLTTVGQQHYHWLRKGAEDIANSTPGNSAILTKYLRDFLEAEEKNSIVIDEFNKENQVRVERQRRNPNSIDPRDVPQDPRWLDAKLNQARAKFDHDFYQNHVSTADVDTQAMWKKYTNHMKGPSIIGGAVKQFYDSDKGGIQVGGLLGAVAGGLLGFKLLGATGGGWFGIVIAAVTTLMGAWVGNRASDAIGGAIKRANTEPQNKPEQPTKAKDKLAQAAPEKPLSTLSHQAQAEALQVGAGTPVHSTHLDLVVLPAGAAPTSPAKQKPAGQQKPVKNQPVGVSPD